MFASSNEEEGMDSLKGPEGSGKSSLVFTRLKYFSSDILNNPRNYLTTFAHVAELRKIFKKLCKKMSMNTPGFAKFANIFYHEQFPMYSRY